MLFKFFRHSKFNIINKTLKTSILQLSKFTSYDTNFSYKILMNHETFWLKNNSPNKKINVIEKEINEECTIFKGNEKDIKSGFIHLCANFEQLEIVIKKYYLDKCITIVQIDNNLIKNYLKFEYVASMNDHYPHLYCPCSKSHVVKYVNLNNENVVTVKNLSNVIFFLKQKFNST